MTVKPTPTKAPTYSETLQKAQDAAETLYDLLLEITFPHHPYTGTQTDLRRQARYHAMEIMHNLENMHDLTE